MVELAVTGPGADPALLAGLRLAALQRLRAVAAMLVVLDHALLIEVDAGRLPEALRQSCWIMGSMGVQAFFVVSGFIMVHTTRRSAGAAGAGRAFLWRRLMRVAPLYWLFTLVALAAAVRRGEALDWPGVAASFLFFPHLNADGDMLPLHAVGWTLNYEMFFYLLFGAALGLPRRLGLAVTMGGLAALAMVGQVLNPLWSPHKVATVFEFWTDPVILLFAAGMALALLWRARPAAFCLPGATSLSLLVLMAFIGAFFILDGDQRLGGWRVAGGLTAVLVVALNIYGRPGSGRATAAMVVLGDASYSLYLVHNLALNALDRLRQAVWPGLTPPVWAALALVGSCAAGLIVHRLIERRLTRLTAAIGRKPAKPAQESAPTVVKSGAGAYLP